MKSQRILITGALGHIGSKFIRSIKPDEFREVLLVDNLSTQRYCSLFNLPDKVPFHFIESDIRDKEFRLLCKHVDTVIHLAAITDATSSFKNQKEVWEVNYQGAQNVAKACIDNGCNLFFPSTTSVYTAQKSLISEDCPEFELRPQSPYAQSKLEAERMLTALGKSCGLKFVICRLGTIFGVSVGMRFHTAINKFCWQACLGEPITVWRTALEQKRPYLDLSDAVRLIKFVIKIRLFDGKIYNAATQNLTVKEIIKIIRKYIKNAKFTYVDAKVMNQLSFGALNSRITEKGFDFNGNLDRRVKETVDLLRNSGVFYVK